MNATGVFEDESLKAKPFYCTLGSKLPTDDTHILSVENLEVFEDADASS